MITSWSAAMPRAARAAAPVAGGEQVGVHAGGDHVDRQRIRPVELGQLAGLGRGVGDQPVGLGDHLVLADQPTAGFGIVGVGERGVLHLGQRVRGVHQRDPPPVPDQIAGLPGQPVVRVHDVVEAGPTGGGHPQYAGGERAQLAGQVLLVQALEGSGDHVPHQHSGLGLDHRRQVRRGGPGEDLHLDAAGGQPARGLGDVDVQAAGVAGAGLGQRRGVHRDGRHRRISPTSLIIWLVSVRYVRSIGPDDQRSSTCADQRSEFRRYGARPAAAKREVRC